MSGVSNEQMQRMQELQSVLKEAANAYYNEDTEIMSNYEYDALYDELVLLEKSTDIILPDSITQGAGVEAQSALPKITHETPMLSLEKTKSRDEIRKWLGEHVGCLSWKLDGSTVVLTYENGELAQAVTRGNGIIGEDITAQAKKFAYVPQSIPCDGKVVVRGEALMTYSEFERVNAQQPVGEKYKNPRNLASGTMRALDTSLLDEREIEFHPFTLVSSPDDASDYDHNSYASRLDWLDSIGFKSVEHSKETAETLEAAINKLENTVEKSDIPSDGLVLFYDDVAYGDSLGSTGHAPRNGMAFKWADETVVTELKEILWNTTRTGRVNPIAEFVPVELEGTTVERATLNNVSFIKDVLGMPFVGQKVRVYKANKIIPTVMTEEKGDGSQKNLIAYPTKCPTCGNELTLQNDHGSEFLMCLNDECPARNESAMTHFVSRDAMNIMGMSSKMIKKLMEAGLVSSFADIMDIPSKREQIVSISVDEKGKKHVVSHVDGFKEKTLDNLCNAIEIARNTTASRFLYALGIREIGRSASKDIATEYRNNIPELLNDCENDNTARLDSIAGIGGIMVSELVDYVQHNRDMIDELLTRITIEGVGKETETSDNDFINGKTFVVTGDVHVFANRNELKAYVELCGGKVSGSVSKNTDYLITNTPDSGTSKNKKAQELGVDIITEDEFCERAGYQA